MGYYEDHRDKILAYQRAYREKNKEKIAEKRKNNYGTQREYTRLYYKLNKERIRETRRRRFAENPSKKIGMSTRKRLQRGIRNNKWSKRTAEIVGCSLEEFKKHLESTWQEGMTWDNYGKQGWHIDHILPVSSFDLTNNGDLLKCFHYSNTQALWSYQNSRKGGAEHPNNAETS